MNKIPVKFGKGILHKLQALKYSKNSRDRMAYDEIESVIRKIEDGKTRSKEMKAMQIASNKNIWGKVIQIGDRQAVLLTWELHQDGTARLTRLVVKEI